MTTGTRPGVRTAQLARQQTARREAQRRRVVQRVGVGLAIALVVAIVAALALASRSDQAPTAAGPVVVPAGATAEGVLAVGDDAAPVTVAVLFDYLCPFCGRFEQANSAELSRLVDSGRVQVELRPLSFLDPQSAGSAFSTRAANALATVADGAPDRVWDFHQGLFALQPQEGTPGLTDEQIGQIGRDAGVPDAVVARFGERTFAPWVADVTERAFDTGVTGTPTVLVDGVVFEGDLYSTGPLTAAVEAAGTTTPAS